MNYLGLYLQTRLRLAKRPVILQEKMLLIHNSTDYNRNSSYMLWNINKESFAYLRVFQTLMGLILGFKRKEKCRNKLIVSKLRHCNSGERGIRTPGTSQYVGFQDRCNRPLCHLSKTSFWSASVEWFLKCDAKVVTFYETAKFFQDFFLKTSKKM